MLPDGPTGHRHMRTVCSGFDVTSPLWCVRALILKMSRPFSCLVSLCLFSWWLSFLSVPYFSGSHCKVRFEIRPLDYCKAGESLLPALQPTEVLWVVELNPGLKCRQCCCLPDGSVHPLSFEETGEGGSVWACFKKWFSWTDFPNLNTKFGNRGY